jgi:hypothetical protein
MSGIQDTPKLDNTDVPETGNDGGEPSGESQQTEGTKSDKQKSKRLKYTFLLSLMSTCISLRSIKKTSVS